MKSIVEKILFYIIGGIVGVIISYLLMTFDIFSNETGVNYFLIFIILAILGVLTSGVLQKNSEIKELRKNNDIRNETVALITHEMQTGLTGTGWAVQMVLTKYPDKLEKGDKDMLDGVLKSIHTTITHSVNLLDISLIDIGKLSVSLEKSTLSKVRETFTGVLSRFSLGAKQHDISFTSDIKLDEERQVEFDNVRLRIILESLLENSIQYTVNEKKEMHISIYNDKNNLLIKVSDTGIGIPDSDKDSIFKEFYRANNARSVLSSGSGIGLYTTYQYVKAHKGKIWFESTEGIGTTFYVSIPLKTMADVNDFLDKI